MSEQPMHETQALRPRTRWIRVGVMLHETSEFRPLFGLASSADGGLMLSPGDYLRHAGRWQFGLVDVPGGCYAGLPGDVRSGSIITVPNAPKLHYHRSGWVTVKLPAGDERRVVRCLPMERRSRPSAWCNDDHHVSFGWLV